MEMLLAAKILDMSVPELTELLTKMKMQEPDLYTTLKELIEDS
jgi:hypothetical protein